jgi:AcrR family transcriptional regulator
MSSPTETTNRPGYGGGRQALLDAAIRVVAAQGLRGLTLRAVAAEAGVTHGLVRHHFGTREGLIEETVLHSAHLSIDASSLEPGTGALHDMASGLGGTIDDQVELQAFQFELLLEARRRPELLPHVRRIYDEYVDATRRELERAGFLDDPDLARVTFAALDGLALQQVAFGGADRTDGAVARLHEVLATLKERLKPSS